jgi:hypothetical protein
VISVPISHALLTKDAARPPAGLAGESPFGYRGPRAFLMPSPSRLIPLLVSSGLLLACGSTNQAGVTPDSVTLIAVDPADFPRTKAAEQREGTGGVDGQSVNDGSAGAAGVDDRPTNGGSDAGSSSSGDVGGNPGGCGNPAGAVYVGDLIDVSKDLAREAGTRLPDFMVQSSPVTSCSRVVAFSRVVPNREYEVKVNVYPDLDGDPKTVDVCTVGGTSVTVVRNDGEDCATLTGRDHPPLTLARPVATLRCYGWQKDSNTAVSNNAAGSGGDTGADGTDGVGGTISVSPPGGPGVALQYRTMTLHYCVETERLDAAQSPSAD